jgi:hypothetical protein
MTYSSRPGNLRSAVLRQATFDKLGAIAGVSSDASDPPPRSTKGAIDSTVQQLRL